MWREGWAVVVATVDVLRVRVDGGQGIKAAEDGEGAVPRRTGTGVG